MPIQPQRKLRNAKWSQGRRAKRSQGRRDKPSQWAPDPCGLLAWASILMKALTNRLPMGIDIHLIANFAALALITLAGPAVIFLLFYRRGAL